MRPQLHAESREAPDTLGPVGKATWERFMVCHPGTGEPVYVYGIAETLIIEAICRLYDRLAMLRSLILDARRDGTLISYDNKGSVVLHPALAQEKQTVQAVHGMIKSLHLPELDVDGAEDGNSLHNHQVNAGRNRWNGAASRVKEG